MHRIIVFSDGDTWEELSDSAQILEVSNSIYEEISSGMKPSSFKVKTFWKLDDLLEEYLETQRLLKESEEVPDPQCKLWEE